VENAHAVSVSEVQFGGCFSVALRGQLVALALGLDGVTLGVIEPHQAFQELGQPRPSDIMSEDAQEFGPAQAKGSEPRRNPKVEAV
jgi:hypothetical protein